MHRNLPLVDAGIMMRAVNKLEVSNIKPLCQGLSLRHLEYIQGRDTRELLLTYLILRLQRFDDPDS